VKQLDPETAEVLALIHGAARAKLCKEPVALDLREVTTMTEVIYVCHAENGRAVQAIAGEIGRSIRKSGRKVPHVEGEHGQEWVLFDMGWIMVHVFLEERREFYALEKLWHDARPVELPDE
jgi:ribosome-associated protein